MYLKSNGKLSTFDCTTTVLNRLKAANSPTELDIWVKTVLDSCAYSSRTTRAVSGTTVSIGRSCVVRVPKCGAYRPYAEWAIDQAGFTFSTGDIVIKGEIEETDITPNNVSSILKKYHPNAFALSVFKDNTAINLCPHYYLEGV